MTTYAEYETGHYAGFAQAYPAARDLVDLVVALGRVLTLEQLKSLSGKDLAKLHPSTAAFQQIAHWARVKQARADSMARAQRGEAARAGLTIPLLPPMPLKLEQALAKKPSARKRARKEQARK